MLRIIFILLLIVIALIPLFFIIGLDQTNSLGSLVWYMLAASSVYYVFSLISDNKIAKKTWLLFGQYLNKLQNWRYKKMLFLLIIIFVLAISGLQSRYYFGGDDTRLFYKYPSEFYTNFVSNIATDASISGFNNFLPPNSISLFLYFMILMDKIFFFFNLQSLLYTVNILLGVYFFYILFNYLTSADSSQKKFSAIASFMYVFSIFNFYVLFNSRLISIFVLSVFPLSLYLFIKGVREGKFYLIVLLSVVISVFTVISISSFWYFASLITVAPLIVYYIWDHKIRTLKYVLGMLILLVLINLHWLAYLSHGTLLSSSGPGVAENSIASASFIEENISGIRSTAKINSIFYPLMNTFHYQIQSNFNWPYLSIFRDWYLKILPFNIVFIATILLSIFLVKDRLSKRKTHLVFLLCFVLLLYFFTVNLGSFRWGNWGVEFFAILTKEIPGFVVFRNMYDKFAHAVAFNFALMFGFSVMVVISKINHKKFVNLYLVMVVFILFLNAKPFLLNEFNRVPIWTTHNYYLGVETLDQDYLELTDYIKDMPYRGRYLQLPLNRGNLALISDNNDPSRYYSGISPLMVFTGKNDLSGVLSFGPFSEDILHAVLNEDYDNAGEIFRKMNSRYVIVKKDIPDELQRSYMFSENFIELQNEDFIASLTGKKIRDFGDSYSLFEINSELMNEKIFLSEFTDSFPNDHNNVNYRKINNSKFIVEVSSLEANNYLIFLEPHSESWSLYLNDDVKLIDGPPKVAFGYANMWQLDKEKIINEMPDHLYNINEDGTLTFDLYIYFEPDRYYLLVHLISLFAIALSSLYIVRHKLKDNV